MQSAIYRERLLTFLLSLAEGRKPRRVFGHTFYSSKDLNIRLVSSHSLLTQTTKTNWKIRVSTSREIKKERHFSHYIRVVLRLVVNLFGGTISLGASSLHNFTNRHPRHFLTDSPAAGPDSSIGPRRVVSKLTHVFSFSFRRFVNRNPKKWF